jgi:transcriptional regulator with XRE-family HTH domain
VNYIKVIRKKLGVSVYDVAKWTRLSPGYISNLENGNRCNPSKETMEKISKALESTVQEVFFEK